MENESRIKYMFSDESFFSLRNSVNLCQRNIPAKYYCYPISALGEDF